MPTALVTGSPNWVPDVTIALKSAGFEILGAGATLPGPDPDAGPVDAVVHVSDGRHRPSEPSGRRPAEPQPWLRYTSVDPELGFADWRDSILCLSSVPGA